MSYTTHSMMSHAELHFQSAQKELSRIDNDSYVTAEWAQVIAQRATAEAQAGLLAVELAKYGAGAG